MKHFKFRLINNDAFVIEFQDDINKNISLEVDKAFKKER